MKPNKDVNTSSIRVDLTIAIDWRFVLAFFLVQLVLLLRK